MTGPRVLVCGSRHGVDDALLSRVLNEIAPSVVIEGGARGVDAQAARWARRHGVGVQEYKADWHRYGRAAGPERNARMLACSAPELVLAFPGPESRGTWDMVRRARAAGVTVRVVESVQEARQVGRAG